MPAVLEVPNYIANDGNFNSWLGGLLPGASWSYYRDRGAYIFKTNEGRIDTNEVQRISSRLINLLGIVARNDWSGGFSIYNPGQKRANYTEFLFRTEPRNNNTVRQIVEIDSPFFQNVISRTVSI
jgi:hypothetical protein